MLRKTVFAINFAHSQRDVYRLPPDNNPSKLRTGRFIRPSNDRAAGKIQVANFPFSCYSYAEDGRCHQFTTVQYLISDVHLVELVDAAYAVVGQHERAGLDAKLAGFVVLHHGSCQTGRTRSLFPT